MGTLKIGWLLAGALAIAVVVVAVLVYARFRRDMRAARDRLTSGGSQVVETNCGLADHVPTAGWQPVAVDSGRVSRAVPCGCAKSIPGVQWELT